MTSRKSKSYCNIITCENNKGTLDRKEQMFRIPSETNHDRRTEWIASIRKHQQLDENINSYFQVCIRHFSPEDILLQGKKRTLKKNSVPKIFDLSSSNNKFPKTDEAPLTPINDHQELARQIETLKKELSLKSIEHDIEIQKLKGQIEHLKQGNISKTSRLKETKKEMSKQKSHIENLLENLKASQFISEDDEKFLSVFDVNEILQCLVKGIKPGEKYPPNVRVFCMSLHYISPKAYTYVRNKFGKNVPHPETIKSWYRNSDLNAKSGINDNVLSVLSKKSADMKAQGQQLIISLLMDEMSITRNMMWSRTNNKFVGLVDIGIPRGDESDESNEFTLANNVIVFMASGLNSYFQVPVAYYFITTLKANDRIELVKEITNEISMRGIKIASLTFDGYSSNAPMCNLLGADLKSGHGDYRTSFPNPYDGSAIYIIYDPSHMEKLVRNTLGSLKVLYDEDNNAIEWKYFVELVKVSRLNNFGLSHKMNKRHIEYVDRKMHVRTAVQTFSASTANSMEFLLNKGIPEFINSSATINFTRVIDTLWDVMNSTRVKNVGNIFTSALNPNNKIEVFQFLTKAKKYLLSLKVINPKSGKKVPVVKSLWRCGFRGYVIDIISVTDMYTEYVEKQHWMNFFATYRVSQDHLEMLFGKIRSMNGHNDNPLAHQFVSAFRKLLFQCDVSITSGSNITPGSGTASAVLCCSNILTVSALSKRRQNLLSDLYEFSDSFKQISTSVENVDYEDDEWLDSIEWGQNSRSSNLTDIVQDSGIIFLAKKVEQQLTTCEYVNCDHCIEVFRNDEKVSNLLCVAYDKPCRSTYKICKLTDTALKIYINTGPQFKSKIYMYVMKQVSSDNLYPQFDASVHDYEHKYFLIKYIIDEYTNKKCAYISKQKTLSLEKKYLRNKLRKLCHSLNQ